MSTKPSKAKIKNGKRSGRAAQSSAPNISVPIELHMHQAASPVVTAAPAAVVAPASEHQPKVTSRWPSWLTPKNLKLVLLWLAVFFGGGTAEHARNELLHRVIEEPVPSLTGAHVPAPAPSVPACFGPAG